MAARDARGVARAVALAHHAPMSREVVWKTDADTHAYANRDTDCNAMNVAKIRARVHDGGMLAEATAMKAFCNVDEDHG